MNRWVFLAALLLPSAAIAGELELPSLFSDHMVLQQKRPVKIWGWAEQGEQIQCEVAGVSAVAKSDQAGTWSLSLDPLPAGGPYTLSVTAGNQKRTISDVYVGEVWLCSGQSNMAMTVGRAADAEREISASKLPRIRMFKVTSGHAVKPKDRCGGEWSVCSPESVGAFSATGFFFGRDLHRVLDVPIGLINSSVGGTAVESWTSMEAQQSNAAVAPVLQSWQQQQAAFDPSAAKATYDQQLARWEKRRDAAKAAGNKIPRRPALASSPITDKNYPSNLYNGKINPIVGYTIAGAIWYQGERNSKGGLSHLYGDQLRTLIADWRDRWNQGDFPFAWVQLPNYQDLQTEPSETSGWVQVREGMLKSLKVPHTGMAITVDVGEAKDIHPKNKQAVGSRLARWALAEVYGKATRLPDGLDPMGPIFQSAERKGKRMRIHFQYAGDELPQPDGGLRGFAIAGKDRKFHWADAEVVSNVVEVWSDAVSEPVAVRYAWAANPIGNLRGGSGVPASPFRTDDWDE